MKIFIFFIFFNIFKIKADKVYKTLFIHNYGSIVEITETSIDFYIYINLRKSVSLFHNFKSEEQKISSSPEGDMISISYNTDNIEYK